MKLEKIHFRNLASLNGEWTIDLTAPTIADAGIFAMAGPVGSGKTTVFDAVRLALFGRTSRLSRMTKNENEIMTSGTRDCFAEVTFSCPSGRYLCQWSQHRAKSGQLQNAKHILAKFPDGSDKAEILTSKLEETRERIRSVTGMDFNHFSRAMILPQGKFADFLQVGAEERSPILEQITGTGIYAEISMRVFEVCRDLKQELELLQESAKNIELIPDEQFEDWKRTIENLRKAASECLKKYNLQSEFLLNRKNLETERSAYTHFQTELPAAEHDCRIAHAALADAEKLFLDSKESRDSLLPLFRRIRELDSRIGMKKEALREFESSIAAHESENKTALDQLKQKEEHLRKANSSLEQICRFLEENKADSILAGELSGLKNLAGTVADLLSETEKMNRNILKIKELEEKAARKTEQLRKNVLASGSSLEEQEKSIETRKTELRKLTDGSSVPEFFQKKEKLQQRKNLLEEMDSLIRQENDLEMKLGSLRSQADSAKEKNKLLEEQLSIQKKLVSQIENNMQLTEQKRLMESKVAAYEKDRKNLADGQCCPLCGSVDHPYIKHKPVFTAENDYVKIRKDLKAAEQTQSVMEQNLNRNMLDLTSLENEIKRLSEEKTQIAASLEKLPWKEFGEDHAGALPKLETELRSSADLLAALDSTARQIEPAMQELSSLEQQIVQMRESHSKLLLEQKESETNLAALHRQHEQSKSDFAEKEKAAKEEAELLCTQLSRFGIPSETSFPDAVRQLEKRSEIYGSQTRKASELEKEIIEEKTFVSAETKRLENEKNAVVLQKADAAKQKQTVEQLEKTRSAEFGNKSVDAEEKRAEDAVKSAEKKKKESDDRVKKAEEHRSSLSTRISEVRKRIAELEKKLTDAGVLLIPLETLQQQISELDRQRQEQNQRIGELSSKLARAEDDRKHAAELLEQIEEKQKKYSKWDYLNSLIGSSDGKKFRDFVQSLTLEKLIMNANEQLRHFSDRYTLISDRETGLEFNVVDAYRGNEIRSSRNLSGGETFLVSLALALGLSHMSQSKSRIDTLFLDEGFGTLDEDSLQHALEQLAGLRRTGKLIGIITHAHGIEDAVPVVLKFTNNGGISTITGPGVEQNSST